MLITQAAAIRKIRAKTGHTEVWAIEAVRKMRKTQSGYRLMVSEHAVDKLIAAEKRAIEWEPMEYDISLPSAKKRAALRQCL